MPALKNLSSAIKPRKAFACAGLSIVHDHSQTGSAINAAISDDRITQNGILQVNQARPTSLQGVLQRQGAC